MVALVAHSGGLMIQDISRAVAHDDPFHSDALRIATWVLLPSYLKS